MQRLDRCQWPAGKAVRQVVANFLRSFRYTEGIILKVTNVFMKASSLMQEQLHAFKLRNIWETAPDMFTGIGNEEPNDRKETSVASVGSSNVLHGWAFRVKGRVENKDGGWRSEELSHTVGGVNTEAQRVLDQRNLQIAS